MFYVPRHANDSHFSLKAGNTYMIFLNTHDFSESQGKWLMDELDSSLDARWSLVFAYDLDLTIPSQNKTIA
jgi:hypothetical protein